MPASKIVSEDEVIRWFKEGRTYKWMTEQYLEKYHIETSPSSWGMFRRRHGLPKRIVRNDKLLPWKLHTEHKWDMPALMLRAEARRREGKTLSEHDASRLENWKKRLEEKDAVVHYDPDTEQGWFYIARQPGDDDLIHEPGGSVPTATIEIVEPE